MNNSPCLGCKQRIFNCHDTCDKYLNFKATNEKISQARIKYKESIANNARHNNGRCKV